MAASTNRQNPILAHITNTYVDPQKPITIINLCKALPLRYHVPEFLSQVLQLTPDKAIDAIKHLRAGADGSNKDHQTIAVHLLGLLATSAEPTTILNAIEQAAYLIQHWEHQYRVQFANTAFDFSGSFTDTAKVIRLIRYVAPAVKWFDTESQQKLMTTWLTFLDTPRTPPLDSGDIAETLKAIAPIVKDLDPNLVSKIVPKLTLLLVEKVNFDHSSIPSTLIALAAVINSIPAQTTTTLVAHGTQRLAQLLPATVEAEAEAELNLNTMTPDKIAARFNIDQTKANPSKIFPIITMAALLPFLHQAQRIALKKVMFNYANFPNLSTEPINTFSAISQALPQFNDDDCRNFIAAFIKAIAAFINNSHKDMHSWKTNYLTMFPIIYPIANPTERTKMAQQLIKISLATATETYLTYYGWDITTRTIVYALAYLPEDQVPEHRLNRLEAARINPTAINIYHLVAMWSHYTGDEEEEATKIIGTFVENNLSPPTRSADFDLLSITTAILNQSSTLTEASRQRFATHIAESIIEPFYPMPIYDPALTLVPLLTALKVDYLQALTAEFRTRRRAYQTF